MGRWLEQTVTSEVQAPAAKVWEVWSDLEAMPRWMRSVSYTHLTLPTIYSV